MLIPFLLFALTDLPARAVDSTTDNATARLPGLTLHGDDHDDHLVGSPGADSLLGGSGNDLLEGGDGDDWLEGGDDNDELYGGPGLDRYLGGPGADRFVIDIESEEVDEILDFDPDEGDVILLQQGKLSGTSGSIKLRPKRIDFNMVDAPADRIRINRNGDVEVRFKDRSWTSLVRTGRSRLDLKINRDGDRLRLRFSQRF